MWDEALVPAEENCPRHYFVVSFAGLGQVGPKIHGCLGCWDARLDVLEDRMQAIEERAARLFKGAHQRKI